MKSRHTFRHTIAKRGLRIFATGFSFAVAALALLFVLSAEYTVSSVIYPEDLPLTGNGRWRSFHDYGGAVTPGPDRVAGILASRETAVEGTLLMMAVHLSETQRDTGATIAELRRQLPADLVRLVDSVMRVQPAADTVTVSVTRQVRKVDRRPRTYLIRAGDNPTRVARKFGLTLDQLTGMNHPMPPFQGGRRLTVGMDTVVRIADTTILEKRVMTPVVPEYRGTNRTGRISPLTRRLAETLNSFYRQTPDNGLSRLLRSGESVYGLKNYGPVRVRISENGESIRVSMRAGDPETGIEALNCRLDVARQQYRALAMEAPSRFLVYCGQDLARARMQLDSLESALVREWFDRTPVDLGCRPARMEALIRLWGELDRARMNYREQLGCHTLGVMMLRQAEQSDLRSIGDPGVTRNRLPQNYQYVAALAFVSGLLIALAWPSTGWMPGNRKISPGSFEKLTGLQLLQSVPFITAGSRSDAGTGSAASGRFDELAVEIRHRSAGRSDSPGKPFVVFLAGSRSREGKTYIASKLSEKLRSYGDAVLYLKPAGPAKTVGFVSQFKDFSRIIPDMDREYLMDEGTQSTENLASFLGRNVSSSGPFKFILVELPALDVRDFPSGLLPGGDLTLFVVKASRHWHSSEAEALRRYRSAAGHPIAGVLNFV